MATQVVKEVLFSGFVAGGVSAVASGAVAWGTRMVNFIPTQSCAGATIIGGISGISIAVVGTVNHKVKFITDDTLRMIGLAAIGVIAATAFGPKAASLAGREISHAASGAFGCVSIVALLLLLTVLPG